jgi:histidinol dehydrogenase
VFLGAYSCESAGDYASGTNHSLPTYGYARVFGGVSVSSFQKQVTFQEITKQGAENLGPIVAEMASQESLEGHKRAMELRYQ